MKRIILFFTFLVFFNFVFAQYTYLEFHYSLSNKNIAEPFNPGLRKTHRNFIEQVNDEYISTELIKFKKNNTEKIYLFRFKILESSSYNISNGFGGSEIFLSPGDSDVITLKDMTGRFFLKDSVPNYFLSLYSHTGKNYNANEFFDSLAFISGAINISSISFKQADHDIPTFFKLSTQEYNKRIIYLDEYYKRHSLSDFFYRLAFKEIHSAYIYNLLSPMRNPYVNVDYNSLSTSYKDSISNFNQEDREAFFNTEWYESALTLFNNIILTKMDYPNYYSPSQFEARFNVIQKYTKDQRIKDELLSKLMFDFLKKDLANYDSLLREYQISCKNIQYKKYIDSVYSLEKKRLKLTKNTAFNTLIENVSGEIIEIQKLIKGKPIVIDCWASWCGPCLAQFKFQKKIDSLYGDKIDFINLSFDKKKDLWLKKNKELLLDEKVSYLLETGFASNFARFLNLSTIPQYIFINKDGSISNLHGLRPSNTAKFIQQLNKMIN